MNQDPVMQGGNTPNQGGNPSVNTETSTNNSTINTVTANNSVEPSPVDPLSGQGGVVTDPAAAPKKKRKGLIALIIVVVVLLLGIGGLAAWYFLYYNNPEKVAYDAIDGFLQQKTVVTDGFMTGRTYIGGNEALITLSIDGKSNRNAGENTLGLKISMLDANGDLLADNEYEFELGSVFMSDGVIYLRTSKFMESIDAALENMGTTLDELDYAEQAIYGLINNIDGEWWQISIPDVIDNVIENGELAHSSKELYACLVNVSQTDINSQIASVYRENRFVNIQPNKDVKAASGYTDYSLSFDYDKMAAFSNGIQKTEFVSNTENCFEKYIVEDLGGNFKLNMTPASADELRKEIGDTKFSFLISDFGHELKAATISVDNDDTEFNATFEFSHPEVNIEAPASYRPISELVDMIIETIMIIESDYDDDYDYVYDEDDWYNDDEFIDWNFDDIEEI